MRKAALALTGLISAQLLLASSAAAQDTAAQPAPVQGDIVVTALRRASTVQTAPLSIVALSGDNLAKTGATQMGDFFRQIPNLNVTSGGGGSNRISIRGINSAGEATVGLYYDETPVTGPSGTTQDSGWVAADLNLFDVSRVEVMRGPQGTLYGASSMAGTMRVIFNKPDATKIDAAGEAQVSAVESGSLGYFGRAMVNAPIVTDKLAVRVVGYYEKKPGWINNVRYGTTDVNDSSNWGFRGMLGYTPDDATSLVLTAVYQKGKAKDQQGWYPAIGRYETNSPSQLPFNSEMQLYNLKGERKLGFGTLTGSASWYKYNIMRSFDFTPNVISAANSAAYCAKGNGVASCSLTQMAAWTAYGMGLLPAVAPQPAFVRSQNYEVRLASDDHTPAWLQWTIGAYYEKRHDHIDSNVETADKATGAPIFPLNPFSYRYVETDERQVAGFGELGIKPLRGLTITAGARYYDYQKTTSGATSYPGIGADYMGNFTSVPYSSASTNANGWIEKFNISYNFTHDIMAYATASKGFRPGGANLIPGLAANLISYAADSLWNYEVGFKSGWLHNRLLFNASVFDVEWSNMQVSQYTADFTKKYQSNAGSARIRGAEVDITARPAKGLVLTGSVGYTDAHLTQNQPAVPAGTTANLPGVVGDRIPNTTDWTASASATYNHPLGNGYNGMLRADYAYTGSMQSAFRPNDVTFVTYGNYSTVNLRMGLERDRWGAYIFCNNVGNVVGNVSAAGAVSWLPSGKVGYSTLAYSIPPRTVGLNLRFGL